MAQTHQAAMLPQKGGPFSLAQRPTPTPGPNEVLIAVKAVALNPVDQYQRDHGMPPVPIYPAVVGSDVAGLIVKAGPNVPNPPAPGSRVLAMASSFYQNGKPDYGAFQQYVLAPSEAVTALPDNISFEEGALFPLAVLTALSSWTTIGIAIGTKFLPEDKKAVLIWGGASSVGTLVVQSAKAMGFIVYATASTHNHDYLKTLGANKVFDYKASNVVAQIVDTVKKEGVVLRTAVCAAMPGALPPTLDVLKETKGDVVAQVAYCPPIFPGDPTLEGVEITFVQPPQDPQERSEHLRKCFQVWLEEGLKSGTVVPSPKIKVMEGGLGGLNAALDHLKAGVSGTKIVVPV